MPEAHKESICMGKWFTTFFEKAYNTPLFSVNLAQCHFQSFDAYSKRFAEGRHKHE